MLNILLLVCFSNTQFLSHSRSKYEKKKKKKKKKVYEINKSEVTFFLLFGIKALF